MARRLAIVSMLFGLLPAWLGTAAARAEIEWVEGGIAETRITSCIGGLNEFGTGAFLAYQNPAPHTPPQVGDVYYVAVVVTGLGDTCSGTIYNPQLILPAGTEPAVSSTYPVYCFASPAKEQAMQQVPGMCERIETLSNGNVQIDSTPSWAGTLGSTPIAPFFPIAQGYSEEENVPVVSTLPLSGGEKLESDIYTTDSGGEHLHPWVAPVVEPAPGGGEGGGGSGGEGGSGGGGSEGGSGGGSGGSGEGTGSGSGSGSGGTGGSSGGSGPSGGSPSSAATGGSTPTGGGQHHHKRKKHRKRKHHKHRQHRHYKSHR